MKLAVGIAGCMAAAVLPGSALAAGIVISEVAWMGSPVEGIDPGQWWRYEWVELWNSGNGAEDLEGWTLEGYREDLDFSMELRGTVKAGAYFVAASSDRVSGADFSYGNLGGGMVNGGQRLVLRNAEGSVADEIDARPGWFSGDNKGKLPMAKIRLDAPSSDPASWITSGIMGGTPGSVNDIPARQEPKRAPQTGGAEDAFPLSALTAPLAVLLSVAGLLLLRRAWEREQNPPG